MLNHKQISNWLLQHLPQDWVGLVYPSFSMCCLAVLSSPVNHPKDWTFFLRQKYLQSITLSHVHNTVSPIFSPCCFHLSKTCDCFSASSSGCLLTPQNTEKTFAISSWRQTSVAARQAHVSGDAMGSDSTAEQRLK